MLTFLYLPFYANLYTNRSILTVLYLPLYTDRPPSMIIARLPQSVKIINTFPRFKMKKGNLIKSEKNVKIKSCFQFIKIYLMKKKELLLEL